MNLASIRKCFFLAESGQRRLWDLLIPAVGFVFCIWIWISLPVLAKIAGGIWLASGILYSAIQTKGFREKPAPVDFGDV